MSATMTPQANTALFADPIGVDLPSRLLLYRRAIVRFTLAVTAATVVVLLALPREWTSIGSFVAQTGTSDQVGQLAGLAQQFGLTIPNATGGYQPRFYAALLTSNEVLQALVARTFTLKAGSATKTVRLPEGLGVTRGTPAVRDARTIKKLRADVIDALYDQRTGLTSFRVRTKSPQLSFQIGAALIAEVNKFNLERHHSRATEERAFDEARLTAVTKELHDVEDETARFLSQNRSYEGSPVLKFEFDRLSRRIGELQQVFSALTQSYEHSRMEEVRDTPVLTVVDAPAVPALADDRGLLTWGVAVAVLGLFTSMTLILVLQMLGVLPETRPGSPARLADYVPVLSKELSRPWRLFL